MIAMFVWGFLVLGVSEYDSGCNPARLKPIRRRVQKPPLTIKSNRYGKNLTENASSFLANDPVPGEDWGLELRFDGGSRYSYFWDDGDRRLYIEITSVMEFDGFGEKDEHKMPHAQKHFRFLGSQMIGTADRTWLIRKPALEDIYIRPANVERLWLKLSPVGLYEATTQAWAGTDLRGIRDFFDTARHYRQQVIDYLYDKEAFGSRQWFSSDKGAADWSGLPHFSFQRVDVNTNAKRSLPDVCLLLMMNVVLFIVIFLIFIKTEV